MRYGTEPLRRAVTLRNEPNRAGLQESRQNTYRGCPQITHAGTQRSERREEGRDEEELVPGTRSSHIGRMDRLGYAKHASLADSCELSPKGCQRISSRLLQGSNCSVGGEEGEEEEEGEGIWADWTERLCEDGFLPSRQNRRRRRRRCFRP